MDKYLYHVSSMIYAYAQGCKDHQPLLAESMLETSDSMMQIAERRKQVIEYTDEEFQYLKTVKPKD